MDTILIRKTRRYRRARKNFERKGMDCFVSFLIFSAVLAALVKLQTTLNTKNPTVTSGCQLLSTSMALLSPMEVTISMKNMSHQFLNYYYVSTHKPTI